DRQRRQYVQHVMIRERQKERPHRKTDEACRERLSQARVLDPHWIGPIGWPYSAGRSAQRAKHAHEKCQEKEKPWYAELGTNLQIAVVRRTPLQAFARWQPPDEWRDRSLRSRKIPGADTEHWMLDHVTNTAFPDPHPSLLTGQVVVRGGMKHCADARPVGIAGDCHQDDSNRGDNGPSPRSLHCCVAQQEISDDSQEREESAA